MSGSDRALPTVGTFQVTADLPWGSTVVLEASAGTGKTYTIASLTARYLAEGKVRLEDMMLVTFGRMATQELRDRVRGRLVEIERQLADPAVAAGSDDEVVALLADADPGEVAQRRKRLATALAAFDEATIATTHSFCQRMLAGLGIAADNEPNTGLLENSIELLRQVVDDEYLRRYADRDAPPFDQATALRLAADAVGIPQARLEPVEAPADTPAGERVAFAAGVRTAFDLRKRGRRVMDFDDLQTRLAEALEHPVRGEAARATLRSAYQVVLVDEFQDTDPVQWKILQAAFHTHSTLVLIGDPKQAIYAFRGADVFTYLAAVDAAGAQQTLGTNWRSDAPLVRALDHLWGGLTLGDPRIRVHTIEARHAGSRLQVPGGRAGESLAPLRIRRLRRWQADQSAGGKCIAKSARAVVATDLAAEVVQLLGSGATIESKDGPPRDISPGDIAVLVHQNDQGVLIRDALRKLGVPVVLTGNASVFDSDAARHWSTLLDALDAPNRASRARSAALTPFIGWTAQQLAAAGPVDIDALIDLLRDWARRLQTGGMSALLETVTVSGGIAERVLAMPDGDRLLTDIRHVAHVMNAVARTEHLGSAALLEWLRHRINEASGDAPEELSRRLSSEDAAVQVLTVHRSKGLEFGVVFVPYAWNRWLPDDPDPLRLHDSDGHQVLDVGGEGGPGYRQRIKAHNAEALGEDLRVMYVAFTRARSMLVTWWVPSTVTAQSPLNRVLLGTSAHGEVPDRVDFGQDADVRAALDRRSAASGGLIAIEEAEPDRTPHYRRTADPATELTVRTFDRDLDVSWRRTSYSGLTKAAHDAHYGALELALPGPHGPGEADDSESAAPSGGGVDPVTGSEPENPGTVDEPAVPFMGAADASDALEAVSAGEAGLREIGSPLEDFPGGTAFGTVVHEVLEYLDTDAADLRAELLAHCERVLGSSSGSEVNTELDPVALAAGLEPVFRTPLGAAAGNLTLAAIPPRDRLAEMNFELPLAGGDDPHTESKLADLADVLQQHLAADELLAGYPELLRDELLAGEPLRGYLNGSLDAVLRVTGADSTPRYLIVDYKTNRLGVPGEALSAWDYRPRAMADAMMTAHYPLQALLYAVALHRYLRWRQPGYDPDVHLGGALYLFVRGMSGPDTPVLDGMPCGVFTWTPSAQLVIASSRVLAGEPR
ncbi:UvrD-helicase domain-containing protein [Nakamurella lactea]|uniref:UvrD-helicase domain-containing protein n=1 Tax=Nakamurella lactea TaxID=459515 RepID=UPI000415DD4A|nr:UvrD-helicase domain-containing protein [Nakamurella lactea]